MDDNLREALATGRELYNKKEYVRAEPYLTQLSEAKVPYADVYNMLGVIHHDGGQFSKAQECFEEALRINPEYSLAHRREVLPFKNPADFDRILEGLGKAGLGQGEIPAGGL